MKKKIFGGIAVLSLVAVAAINMNLGTKDNHLLDISLANMEQLAMAEDLPEVVITCDYPSCNGKQCHRGIGNLVCRCEFTGNTYSLCF